jgi:acetoin utilization deacetylase AcuC-like enzyme
VLVLIGPAGAKEHAHPGHPERPARIDAVMAGLSDLHLGSDLASVEPRAATVGDLARVHDPTYVERLQRFCAEGGGALDADTYAGPTSFDAALLAAGAGLTALEEAETRDRPAFVPVRPPGHHALAGRPMGFCLFNNVAVAAARLLEAGERVAVVDWDVHHGNGTQALFWDEPDLLYVSVHQWPCYPGTGAASEIGGPSALGSTLNVPLPPGATGDVVRAAFDLVVTPAVERFAPSWVLVSAGYDAHRADPLAELALSAGDFAALARVVAGYAPRPGRLVVFLEGGYDLGAVRSSVSATFGALTGADTGSEHPTSGGPGIEQVRASDRERRALLEEDPEPGGG